MKRILDRYLFRQLAATFLFATGSVTFVVLFTQSFRLLSLVIENSSTMLIFFQLLGLSALTFLPFLMPLGLGVAVIFVHNKLATDSELVIMRAAGLGPARLVVPSLALAGLVAGAGFLLTLWITPAANRSLVTLQYEMRGGYAVFLSHPGSFNDLAEGLTFYANRRGPNGSLEGILIHDVRDPANPVTTMAATGQVVDSGGQPSMIVFDGRRQQLDRTTGKLSELAFDQYVLDLQALRNTPHSRLPDPREQTVRQLLHPSAEMIRARGPVSHFRGELHARLATPLLAISYALIGLAAILAGAYSRRGMAGRILTGSAAIVVTQAAFMTLSGYVARDSDLTALLYATALLPAPCAAFMLAGGWRDGRQLLREALHGRAA